MYGWPKDIDEKLFRRWWQGDEEARNIVCTILMNKFQQTAIQIMKDDHEGATVFEDTFMEMEEEVQNGKFRWKGKEAFYNYFKKKLGWRCKDRKKEIERERKVFKLLSELFLDEEEERRKLERLKVYDPEEAEREEERREFFQKLLEEFEKDLTLAEKEVWEATKGVIKEAGYKRLRPHELTGKIQEKLGWKRTRFYPANSRMKRKLWERVIIPASKRGYIRLRRGETR